MESSSATLVQTEDGFQPVFFSPRALKNLLLVDEVSSLAPITDMKVPGRGGGGRLAPMTDMKVASRGGGPPGTHDSHKGTREGGGAAWHPSHH